MLKNFYQRVAVIFAVMLFIAMTSPMVMFAGSLDDLSSGSNSSSQSSDSSGSRDDGAISDYLRGYTPVTNENMQNAGTIASPIVSALGTLSGVLIMFGSAAIFVVTALDLLYIGLPFTRSILNPQYAAGGAAAGGSPMGGMGGMGGMGMGMGMRGGMMGGGMMGAGGGAAGAMPEHGIRRKWVSDEAVFCVNTYATGGASPQAAGGGMSPMGGMGGMGGMGMMGGGMMGGGMGGGAQAQEMPMKSVIFEYLKKRTFFIIIFAVCTVLLMSSVLTDCGLNIAQLAIKIFTKVNGAIANVNV